ncbi:MAG TPA: endonuclease/exonuclease/phosphatase family protein [Gemmatimonadales bacterium]|nr:endonuclease/exonuclease/phosphatase family protein [Gemmatimonadales bacterium]
MRRFFAAVVCWLPPALLGGITAALWLLVDRWWPMVPLGYGPRWPWLILVPIPLLAAVPWRRRFASTSVSLVIATWGILGWRVPSPWRDRGDSQAAAFSVVTFNAGLSNDGVKVVLERAAERRADLVVVVECPRNNLRPDLLPGGAYRHTSSGEVCVWSRSEQDPVVTMARRPVKVIGWSGTIATLTVPGTTLGPVGVVHLRSVRNELTEFLDISEVPDQKVELSAAHQKRISGSIFASEWFRSLDPAPSIILGDFNLVPESYRLRHDWRYWNDSWEEAGLGTGYTWSSSWSALRIDRVIHDRSWSTRSVSVGAGGGSDHRPVFVELVRSRPR